ncbi:haloacid dehalogenase type II [uncultured Jatrophihabitans sp.]|uniref:haloacid dehalogenase type II n=1 Tax=uncultured Jatrophihabitans sp. TaxID=1610747 RepID=UPI0035CB4676
MLVFDVNDTLTDQSLFARRLEQVGAPGHIAHTWYASTLRDGIALTLLDAARPYADVAGDVLRGLLHHAQDLDRDVADAAAYVLDGFAQVPAHPDVAPGLRLLADAGHRLVTLSNGSVDVAHGMLERAGVIDTVELLLSAEDAGAWKPDPRAYRYAAERTGVPLADLVMVAAHPWDLAGAAALGMRTAFVDRTGAPWPDVFRRPDLHVGSVGELDAALRRP